MKRLIMTILLTGIAVLLYPSAANARYTDGMSLYGYAVVKPLALSPVLAVPGPVAPSRVARRGQYADGMNLYEYVRSAPIQKIDASGRISVECCKKMLRKSFGNKAIFFLTLLARKTKDGWGIPCLGRIKCKKTCTLAKTSSAYYNPTTRNISLCSSNMKINMVGDPYDFKAFQRTLIHELSHAVSLCGEYPWTCKSCMIEEKRAEFLSGRCATDRVCTEKAWKPCNTGLRCFGKKSDDYLGVGWPIAGGPFPLLK